MTAISAIFTRRISVALGYLSDSSPATAENRKKGTMNTPPARATSCSGDRPASVAPWKVMVSTSAFLNRLSLKAPQNCVAKRGQKLREKSRLCALVEPVIAKLLGNGRKGATRGDRAVRGGARTETRAPRDR